MVWHIARRELYDNLNSLRFALATVLLLGLMLTNAIVHLQGHPERVQRYHDAVRNYQENLTARAESGLYELARKGPGTFNKSPSSLHFCAEGGETFLPERVISNYHRWGLGDGSTESFWILEYPTDSPNLNNVRPDVTTVDWGFIIGYVLSLLALLFTFDAIAGERERGTLRLILANSVPRYTLLIGKFLGALISLGIPFVLAVLVNLLVISTSSDVHFGIEEWRRLAIIFGITLLYTSLFLSLGLLVSARVQRSAISLVILLLIWATVVVFMPSTLASIASGRSSPLKSGGFSKRSWDLHDELEAKYRALWSGEPDDSPKKIRLLGEFVITDAEQQERLHRDRLNQRVAQVNRARNIIRMSPVTITQQLLELFAGTGFERHQQFLHNVKTHARQFRTFIAETENLDTESRHVIGVQAGMSQRAVNPAAVPKFEDTLNLTRDFNAAAVDLLVLTVFLLVLLSGAFLAFVRVEV